MARIGVWFFHPEENAIHDYKFGHMDLEVDGKVHHLGRRRKSHERTGVEGILKPLRRGDDGQVFARTPEERAQDMKRDLEARASNRFPIGPVRSSRLYAEVDEPSLERLRTFLKRAKQNPPLCSLMAVDTSHNCATFVLAALVEAKIVPANLAHRRGRYYLPVNVFGALEAVVGVEDHVVFHREEWVLDGTTWQFLGKQKPEEM
jgi:hypothetical protein